MGANLYTPTSFIKGDQNGHQSRGGMPRMSNPPDLNAMWRDALREWEKNTNAALNKAMGEEAYSRSVNGAMAAMLKLQAAHGEAVEQALIKMNLPNRADFRAVMSRMDDIERKLDALAERLDAASERTAEPLITPKRTRKAPRPEGGA